MSRSFSALNAINNNIACVVDPTSQPMYVMHEVEVEDVDKYGEAECGAFFVEDEQAARLVLDRALGQPEHVLYEDEKVGLSYLVDNDKLAQLIEFQMRMETGMSMIEEQTIARDVLREEYKGLKERITRGFEMIKEERDNVRKAQLRTFMVKVVDEKNSVGRNLGACNDLLSSLWDHWNKLKDVCKDIVGEEKAIWVKFFEIEDKEEWFKDYIDDCLYEDEDKIYRDAPEVDNRMLVSHQVYCYSHLADNSL